jgi:3-dehydroquinate synthase
MHKNIIAVATHAVEERYDIFVGKNNFIEIITSEVLRSNCSSAIVVADANVSPARVQSLVEILDSKVKTHFISLAGGEEKKSIENVISLWSAFESFSAGRQTIVILLGGGSVGDLAGFASATYMRGMRFIQVPTTLLSQVDASIGGKLGFNFAHAKNLVGVFAQPFSVVIDTAFLDTLPDAEFTSGLAEVIKHGLIFDKDYFDMLDNWLVTRESDLLPSIIFRSCQIKRDIVAQDPKEKGLRKLLNLGHTFGHAFEALSHSHKNYCKLPHPLLHGEAVSLGICVESLFASKLGILSKNTLALVENILAKAQLPTVISDCIALNASSIEIICKLMRNDKKNSNGLISCTMLNSIGEATYDVTLTDAQITEFLLELSL